jgi:hypothetical protein
VRKDLVVIPSDEPGILARLGQALGAAGVNVDGCSAFTGGGKGVVHLLVDDAERGVTALADAGYEVKAARRVAVAPLENRPGSLGDTAALLADNGVNIEQAYFANDNQLVIVCDDVDAAKRLLGIVDAATPAPPES